MPCMGHCKCLAWGAVMERRKPVLPQHPGILITLAQIWKTNSIEKRGAIGKHGSWGLMSFKTPI